MIRRECISRGLLLIILIASSAMLSPADARAGACVSGTLVAAPSDRPELGQYVYRMTVLWGPLSHGLSHLDLWLGQLECDAICDGHGPFGFPDTAGTSSGGPQEKSGCPVYYSGELACNGDPSIHLPGPLIKYVPLPGQSCVPGKSGSGLFVFYSDWAPGPSDEVPNVLIAKFGNNPPCLGTVTGTFPACGVHATGTENTSWGSVKSLYR